MYVARDSSCIYSWVEIISTLSGFYLYRYLHFNWPYIHMSSKYAYLLCLPDLAADNLFLESVLTSVVVNRLRSSSSKGPENVLLRRPPVSRAASSQEALSELNVDSVRGKSVPSAVTPDGKMWHKFCRTLSKH